MSATPTNSPNSAARSTSKHAILFVCLGNICRSPMAEAVFLHLARQRNALDRFHVDSCGTGHWHIGDTADSRTIATLKRFNVPIVHTARQFDADRDPRDFELIVAMDSMNLRDLMRVGVLQTRIRLMRSFDPGKVESLNVPDPYTGGPADFEDVYHMLTRACSGMLDELLDGETLRADSSRRPQS